jgi:hypothetical protein
MFFLLFFFFYLFSCGSSCFHFVGFDILFDSNFKAWLLELNTSPSLNIESTLDLNIKKKLLEQALNLLGFLPNTHEMNNENICPGQANCNHKMIQNKLISRTNCHPQYTTFNTNSELQLNALMKSNQKNEITSNNSSSMPIQKSEICTEEKCTESIPHEPECPIPFISKNISIDPNSRSSTPSSQIRTRKSYIIHPNGGYSIAQNEQKINHSTIDNTINTKLPPLVPSKTNTSAQICSNVSNPQSDSNEYSNSRSQSPFPSIHSSSPCHSERSCSPELSDFYANELKQHASKESKKKNSSIISKTGPITTRIQSQTRSNIESTAIKSRPSTSISIPTEEIILTSDPISSYSNTMLYDPNSTSCVCNECSYYITLEPEHRCIKSNLNLPDYRQLFLFKLPSLIALFDRYTPGPIKRLTSGKFMQSIVSCHLITRTFQRADVDLLFLQVTKHSSDRTMDYGAFCESMVHIAQLKYSVQKGYTSVQALHRMMKDIVQENPTLTSTNVSANTITKSKGKTNKSKHRTQK